MPQRNNSEQNEPPAIMPPCRCLCTGRGRPEKSWTVIRPAVTIFGKGIKMHVENGKIESTMLGYEDHGILTCFLRLAFNGSGQGFGGYALDGKPGDDGVRRGTAFGTEFIAQVMRTLEVDSWEKLPGTHCRARRKNEFGDIVEIGHIFKDKWFNPKSLAASIGDQ